MDRETIRKVKEEIKQAALFQKENKIRFHNMVVVVKPKKSEHKIEGYRFQQPWEMAAEITALINFYHEIRGSAHRQGLERYAGYGAPAYKYRTKMEGLREKYLGEEGTPKVKVQKLVCKVVEE